jgi:transcription elongation factor GreB
MGRYRPPQPKASPYITPEGFKELQQELDNLWKRRADVTQALAAAAAEGDRSENAEYIYRKKELAGIDRRIRYLQKRIPELNVVNDAPTDNSQVFFGAWVTLEDLDGLQSIYRIVGPDEYNLEKSFISMDSPMAKALMKKRCDDEVSVNTPRGRSSYYIVDIRYHT